MRLLVGVLLITVVSSCVPRSLIEFVSEKIDSTPFLLKDSINAFNSKLFKSLTTSEAGNISDKIDSTPFLLKDSINAFNSKLFKSLTTSEAGNIIYSPFSLHMLLSQAYFGAPRGTPTSAELAKLLAFEPTDSNNQAYLYDYLKVIDRLGQVSNNEGAEVNIANRLFAAEDLKIKNDFNDILQKFYNSEIQNVDFKNAKQTADIINEFVKDKTKGLITKVLESDAIDGLTRLVLINTVYFKGVWKTLFKAENTKTEQFHVDSNRTVDFSAMKQTQRLAVAHIDEINANVVELPYTDGMLAMIVVVPSDNNDVKNVAAKLENFDVSKISDKLRAATHYNLNLVFPKFEAEYSWDALEDVLRSLGVESVFDLSRSNLREITDEAVNVDKVVHKATIKVNEQGSEAAAVSSAIAINRSRPQPVPEMVVDRPFIFYIYDVINQFPLFVGRIVDPNGELKLQ